MLLPNSESVHTELVSRLQTAVFPTSNPSRPIRQQHPKRGNSNSRNPTPLLQQHHALNPGKISHTHAINVNPTGDLLAKFICAIPNDRVKTRIHCFLNQGANFLTEQIVDHQLNVTGFGQPIFNCRGGVKRIWYILFKGIICGHGLERINAFFASIPYEWYTNNDIANFEGYYASVFYSYFAGLGLNITVEDSSSHGRLDMAVDFNDNIYLFEFKVVEMASEGAAMAQLQEKRYADKYRGLDQPIHLIAVEFSKNIRNITAFEVAHA